MWLNGVELLSVDTQQPNRHQRVDLLNEAAADHNLRVLERLRHRDAAVAVRIETEQYGFQGGIELSDRLPQLFMAGDPLLGVARVLGLAGLDVVPAAKRQFVHYAAGQAALTEGGT